MCVCVRERESACVCFEMEAPGNDDNPSLIPGAYRIKRGFRTCFSYGNVSRLLHLKV